VVIALVVPAGCGSDDDSGGSGGETRKSSRQQIPEELLGSYETTLKRSDLPPSPPGELTGGSMSWELTIAKSGGVNNGPVFAIANADAGSLEGPAFSVNGDHIVLHREECAAGGDEHFYDNKYSYKLTGKTLVLKKVKNLCPDKVALTVLTSEPWTKSK
jgi:hypothetical protein